MTNKNVCRYGFVLKAINEKIDRELDGLSSMSTDERQLCFELWLDAIGEVKTNLEYWENQLNREQSNE